MVEGEAAISVASTIEPPRSSAPRASRCHRFEHRVRQPMRFEQVPEVQDRRLVGNRIAAKLKIAEVAHRLNIVARFLGIRIGQLVPLLQAVDAQHHGDRKRSTASLRSDLWVVRVDQCLQN